MTKARAFYGGVLGLKEGSSWENAWVEYDVGSSTLALSTMMTGAQPGAKGGAIALETEQFEDAVALLKAHGIRFVVEPFDSGVCRFARFEDPDGNPLILHRRHPEARP